MEGERQSKIKFELANDNGKTTFEFEGDARDFPAAISYAANASGGDIRPAAPPPLIAPSAHRSALPPPVTISDVPTQPAQFQSVPLPAQIGPGRTGFNLPTIIQDKNVRNWTGRIIGITLIALALMPIWMMSRSPLAQNNLKRIWFDATTTKPQAPPTKK